MGTASNNSIHTSQEVYNKSITNEWPVYGANNHAPVVANAIPNQLLVAGSSINYQFPINTFSDQDVGDVLTFTTSTLPGWLTFNPSTRTFSGVTPSTLGVTTITVTATDLYGFTANSIFTITHDNAPIAANVIPNQLASNGVAFSFQFNSNTFTDPDLETLTYSATGMPTGITFTPSTRTFSGTPTVVSSPTVTVTATDPGGLSITSAFVITVVATEATGGIITYSSGYTIHTFLSNGTFLSPVARNVEYLVVAGGGEGGDYYGGGGGAGGLLSGTLMLADGSYPVVVGAGGLYGYETHIITNGSNSTFSTLTAIGGGAGGWRGGSNGYGGGSGGGGGGSSDSGGAGVSGQGYAGGIGYPSPAIGGGGGGGAGGVGGNTSQLPPSYNYIIVGGSGGPGINNSISGTSIGYAGGGGGGGWCWTPATASHGGSTGATSRDSSLYISPPPRVNSGGGGGGAGSSQALGSAGATGIVIIRYLS